MLFSQYISSNYRFVCLGVSSELSCLLGWKRKRILIEFYSFKPQEWNTWVVVSYSVLSYPVNVMLGWASKWCCHAKRYWFNSCHFGLSSPSPPVLQSDHYSSLVHPCMSSRFMLNMIEPFLWPFHNFITSLQMHLLIWS
jgi:hypothetical protein